MRSYVACLIGLWAATAASPAVADPIEDFYRGKQIKLYIRAAPGGNYDIYSRVLGRHLTRFIPGNPLVVPINMPGGGGLVALNFVANAAPRDGTVITMITQSFPLDQALGLDSNLKVDMRSLQFHRQHEQHQRVSLHGEIVSHTHARGRAPARDRDRGDRHRLDRDADLGSL